MLGERVVLLHLRELLEVDDSRRILLSVDHALLEGRIDLGPVHGHGRDAEGSEEGDVDFGRQGPELQALQVFGRADGPLVVGDVAKAVVPPPHDLEALLPQEGLQGLAHAAIEGGEHRVGVLPQVGEDEGSHLRHKAAHVGHAAENEVEGAEPDHLQALPGGADRVGVEDLDVNLAVRRLRDELLEFLRAPPPGVILRVR